MGSMASLHLGEHKNQKQNRSNSISDNEKEDKRNLKPRINSFVNTKICQTNLLTLKD